MPVSYLNHKISPSWLPNGHFQSIYPALFRKVSGVKYFREKIVTSDDDFLNLDWSQASGGRSHTLAILSHGLEGDSERPYILGMVRALNRQGYDCLAWNFRGCGGEMNQTAGFYHSGATDDLHAVVEYALDKGYERIFLVGFSLGGNLTLKYLGERDRIRSKKIEKAVVFSVPMDLKACSHAIIQRENAVYMHRFMRSLKPKVAQKAAAFPERIKLAESHLVRTLYDFDDLYTAPLHGFKNAEDYYRQCSSMFFVENITVPTLIVNAANDPIVPLKSLPVKKLENHPEVTLEITRDGGHCGFRPAALRDNIYWSEQRASAFFAS